MDLQELCIKAKQLIEETGLFLKSERQQFQSEKIEVKGKSDYVTYLDKASEKKLVEGLSILLPEAGFIAEEGTSTKKGEVYNWIIDPIDGTTNFIHGLTPHSISVALMRNDTLILGIVHEISHSETFYAWEGSKAYCNDKEISVSQHATHQAALVATGLPYTNFSQQEKYMEALTFFMENTQGIRRLGSAAIDLAYVACGRFEAFWEYGLHPWDVAAGAFLIQQAGGQLCDFNSGNDFLFGGNIVAANSAYFDTFSSVIKAKMGN